MTLGGYHPKNGVYRINVPIMIQKKEVYYEHVVNRSV